MLGLARDSWLTLSFAAHVVIISSADGASVGGNLGPELSALLSDGAGNVLALHFTLVVDNDTCGILEVQEVTLTSADVDFSNSVIALVDLTGKRREITTTPVSRNQTTLSNLDAGIYFLTVTDAERQTFVTKRIIVLQ